MLTLRRASLLVSGYVVGQGVVLVGNLVLLSLGQAVRVWEVSFALGLMLPLYWLVDFGATSSGADLSCRLSPAVYIAAARAVRLRVAVLGVTLALLSAAALAKLLGPFAAVALLCAAPGIALAARNCAGMLDRMSGDLHRLTQNLHMTLAGLAAVMSHPLAPELAGALFGSAFTVGVAMNAWVQARVLKTLHLGNAVPPSEAKRAFRQQGRLFVASFLPGQASNLIWTSAAGLVAGPAAGGVVAVLRSVLFGVIQIGQLIGRAETDTLLGLQVRELGPVQVLLRHRLLLIWTALVWTAAASWLAWAISLPAMSLSPVVCAIYIAAGVMIGVPSFLLTRIYHARARRWYLAFADIALLCVTAATVFVLHFFGQSVEIIVISELVVLLIKLAVVVILLRKSTLLPPALSRE